MMSATTTGGPSSRSPRTAIVEPTTADPERETRPMTTSARWPQTGTASVKATRRQAVVSPISSAENPRSARIAGTNG